ncbi:MAG: hypothetical protein V5A38_12105 [Halolamina sp.]|uniref:hypothetical protein n=1 Tax=Halolamina sp. TaxID=1940283 RepID=UPI002FC3A7E3
MSERECQRSRSLKASFRPRLPDRLDRLLFDSGKPGRPSVGETTLWDRLTQWRRDRRWYSKQLRYSDDDGWL